MHIAITGPCSPERLTHHLYPDHVPAALAYPGFGGTSVTQLVDALVGLGHRVTVVTTGEPGAEPARFVGERLEVVCSSRRSPGAAIRDGYRWERRDLSAAIRESAADLVNSHWTYEFALAAQDSGLMHLTTAHDAPVTILRHAKDAYRTARLLVAARVRASISELSCVSPDLAGRWRREMLYRRPIRIIPNPIPMDVQTAQRAPSAHPTLLEVADSSPWKNVKNLLRAAAQVRRKRPDLETRLVGHGLHDTGELAAWARRKGLAEGVKFLGPLDRASVRREYATAWLFVHASLQESFGMSVLEAACCGVPALGGAHSGAVPFVLGKGRAGWLADVKDPDALAARIGELIASGPPQMRPGAKEWLQVTFAPPTIAQAYVDWYLTALDD